VGQHGYSFEQLKSYALKSERVELDSFHVYDHFYGPLGNSEPDFKPQLEAWMVMAALSEVTKKIRLGALVNCVLYRYPSMLAKQGASFDVISNGRLDFFVGAGCYEHEFTAYGISFPSAGVRIKMLAEAIQIIRKMWTEEKPSFAGTYYMLKEAINEPKPIQKPHPPIWVGGWGPKVLKVAVQYGDGHNLGWTSFEEYKQKSALLDQYCDEFGKKDFKRSFATSLWIGKDRETLEKKWKEYQHTARRDRSAVTFGTPEEVAEQLGRFIDETGVSYFLVNRPGPLMFEESIQIFCEEVIPLIKK
ncbi:MAG: LLM class flavin-dependent oxidoreductase, partial [Candidatus Hodarchaeota archaeon]